MSTNSYSLRVTTDNSNTGFDSGCTDRQDDVNIPSDSTSYTATFTLHGCTAPGGAVTATLLQGSTTAVAVATTDVTVVGAPAQNSKATGAPTIGGIIRIGKTLTADTMGIADDDGLTNVSYGYQWMADDVNIQGATDPTYTLADDDEGKTIKVTVSFTDDADNAETLTSAPTDAVAGIPIPGRPQGLDGEASELGIDLTWSAPPGDTVLQYIIYRAELENGQLHGRPMTKYATIDATGEAMAYTDAEVEDGVEYRYRVAGVNSAGEGKKSNWLDIATEEPSP